MNADEKTTGREKGPGRAATTAKSGGGEETSREKANEKASGEKASGNEAPGEKVIDEVAGGTLAPSAEEDLKARYGDIDFSVSQSIRYHAKRRAWFETLDYTTKILTVISSAAAFAVLFDSEGVVGAKVATAIVVFFTLTDVVVGFGTRARRYDDLYRRFHALAVSMAANSNPTETDIRQARVERLMIETDEPGVMTVLARISRNEEIRARGYGPEHLQYVTRLQRFFAQLVSLPSWRV